MTLTVYTISGAPCAWRARVAGLPGVDETVPIHWQSGNQ